MSKSSYYHALDGEWVKINMREYREQCCDCGLVHRVKFRYSKERGLEAKSTRDPRATNGARSSFHYAKDPTDER